MPPGRCTNGCSRSSCRTTSGPAALVCDGADGNDRVELPGAASVLVDGSLVEVYRADGTTHTYTSDTDLVVRGEAVSALAAGGRFT